jgi:hypothetical protein
MTEEQRTRIADLLAAEIRAAIAARLAAGADPADLAADLDARRRRVAALS